MTTVVRYRVKPGEEERNEQLVRAVYAELHDAAPQGFRYGTFRLDDGRTFVHVAVTEGDEPVPLPGLAAFAEFRAGLEARCEEGPDVRRAELIGDYALLD